MPFPEKVENYLRYFATSATFNDSYSETKAEGEKLVIKATVGMASHVSIFDQVISYWYASLVTAARAGKLKFIVGDGNNLYDFTYVENVAHGHVCAERALASEETAKKAAGQAYFITNMQPIKFWEFVSLVLEVAHLVEWTYRALSRYGMPVPQLTPSRIRLLSCNRTFNGSKAKDQLGYEPIVSLEDGLKKTIESYSHLRARPRKQISKASIYLGNGNFAKTVLWKDKKQTFTVLLLLAAVYYHLFACGYTFITATAKLLSLTALFLFIHGMLPTR
ncbi:3beta-hydroxysteroid-dehydrogenase/decarboxylase isoform 2, partial [Ananas comosus]